MPAQLNIAFLEFSSKNWESLSKFLTVTVIDYHIKTLLMLSIIIPDIPLMRRMPQNTNVI